jgi:hypothetical protein
MAFKDIIPSLIVGAGAVGASTGRGLSSRRQQRRQQAYTRELMHSAQSHQMTMDSTKYQRTMADMKAAGLNPALMYQQGVSVGGGTSSPSGASAGAGQGDVDLSPVVSTAQNQKRLKQDIKASEQTIKESGARIKTEKVKQWKMLTDRNSIPGKVTGDMQKALTADLMGKMIFPELYKSAKDVKPKQKPKKEMKEAVEDPKFKKAMKKIKADEAKKSKEDVDVY